MTYEEAVLKILCEINNRMNDIAITLQTAGILNATKEDNIQQEYITKLSELLSAQKTQYATSGSS